MTRCLDLTLKHIDKIILLRQESVPSANYVIKVGKKHTRITFKVNNNDTRTMSSASIVNFERISHFVILLLLFNLIK